MEKLIERQNSGRVIVPISTRQINNQALSHAVYKLSEHQFLSVLYLVLADESDDLLEISRDMATMKAVTSSNKLSVDVMTIENDTWLDVLREIANPKDLIVCQQDQTVIDGNFKTIPIADYLTKNFDIPVYLMKDLNQHRKDRMINILHEIAGDLGFLVIISIFTWLQLDLEKALSVNLAQILISGTFILEVALIWAWYKLMFA